MTGNRTTGGFILAEMMIALAIFTITTVAIFGLVYAGKNGVIEQGDNLTASNYAQEGIEAARVYAHVNGWENVPVGTFGLTLVNNAWQTTSGATTQDKYSRLLTTEVYGDNIKVVSSTVSWQNTHAVARQVTQLTSFGAWEIRHEENELSGDWRIPTVAGSSDITPAGNSGMNLVVSGNYAYLVSQHGSNGSTDFHIFDITTPPNPTIRSSLNLDNSTMVDVAVSGNYAYALSNTTANQVFVVDITSPTAPTFVRSFVCHGGSKAKSLDIFSGNLFVGLEANATGPELCKYTLGDNPALVSTNEIGANVNDVSGLESGIVLATSADDGEVIFMNNTVTPPTITSRYNAPGSADGLTVELRDFSLVYLGRQSSTDPDFYIIFNSPPYTSPSLRYSFRTNSSIYNIELANHLAFLATSDTNNELKILDISFNSAITRYDTTSLNFPQQPIGMDFSGNRVYFSVQSNQALRVIGPS